MTSRKSFRNPAVFTFGSNVKKHLFVSAGIAAMLFVYYGSIWRIIGNYRYALKHDPSVAQEFRDYLYVFRTDISDVPLHQMYTFPSGFQEAACSHLCICRAFAFWQ